jgi:hypothetical protein
MSKRHPITVLALVLASSAFLVACGGGDNEVSLTPGKAQIVSASELADFAAESDAPIYWVGEREGAEYELTETASGRIYIRYLRGGAEAGDPRSKFLTVGTYPAKNGVAALRRVARSTEGAKLKRTRDGALLMIDPSSEDNVHLAYPGGETQVEVYSRVPGQALLVSAAGKVREVR